MVDLNKIIAGSKLIEKILTEKFNATGLGLSEKLETSRPPIPDILHKRIKRLARLRNRCVHEDGFILEDSDAFLAECQAVCRELEQVHSGAAQTAPPRQSFANNMGPCPTIANRSGLELFANYLAKTEENERNHRNIDQGITETEAKSRVRGILATAAVLTSFAILGAITDEFSPRDSYQAVNRRDSDPDNISAPPSGHAQEVSPAATKPADTPSHEKKHDIPPTRTAGIGNAILEIKDLRFHYFTEPEISITLKNISNRTLSSAHLDTRLYINEETTPVSETSFDLYFDRTGLAPGAMITRESRRHDITNFPPIHWAMPDVINAYSHTLVVRVSAITDGRDQEFGEGPRPWPALDHLTFFANNYLTCNKNTLRHAATDVARRGNCTRRD